MNLDRSRSVIDTEWCSELMPGGPYFTVSYHESGVNLPEVETLVYLGSTQLEKQEGEAEIGFLFRPRVPGNRTAIGVICLRSSSRSLQLMAR